MPHNLSLEPKPHAFRSLFGQRPLTHFKDYRSSIKVDLIKYDDRQSMLRGTYDFVKATWSEDGRESDRATETEMEDALQQMLSGKALGLGLETVNFMFRISGITRIDTHQIVRQRIGVTFSQQCTGDRMLHHNDVLVEESIDDIIQNRISFENSTLQCKNTYASMIDRSVSIQAARSILPHNLETFIFMNVNLMTLLFFHQKRIDDGSQTWQINVIAQQMADEVCKIYPEMKEVFERNKTKFKFQKEASADRKNLFSTSLYLPKEDSFDYNERDFLYNTTKEAMHFRDKPAADSYFWGFRNVSKSQYNYIKSEYSKLDNDAMSHHYRNDEILQKAEILNSELENNIESLP